jgi:hypothetical protein
MTNATPQHAATPTDVTTDAGDVPTPKPQPKVIAGTIGAGVGAAVAEVGIWIVESAARIDIPAGVEAAIAIIVVAGLGFVAGYLKKPSASAS